MSTTAARRAATVADIEEIRGRIERMLDPLESWAQNCHQASLRLVRSGCFDPRFSRVARGSCVGVPGQHSWVVIGHDVYDPIAVIVDPTLWSYDETVTGIWIGSAADERHVPHGGTGTIWTWGQPEARTTDYITLTPSAPLSRSAERFLEMLGPLDYFGWATLCDAPVAGWPAAEIIAAIDDTRALKGAVPVDILGMLTDRNPGELYLREAVR
jgi:hypothetical protein